MDNSTDPALVGQKVEKQVSEHVRRRAARFSAGNLASWAVLLLALGGLMGAIRLDLSFMLKWVPFIAGYTTITSVLVPMGILLLGTAAIGFPARRWMAVGATALVGFTSLWMLVGGLVLLTTPGTIPGVNAESAAVLGRADSARRLIVAGVLMLAGAGLAYIARGEPKRRRRIMLPLLVLGGILFVVGLGSQSLSVNTSIDPLLSVPIPFVEGVGLTIGISLLSILFAMGLALLGALGRLSRFPPFYAMATFYISLIRGTPLVVQIFFVFLALPQIGQALHVTWLTWDPVPSGIFALSLNYGAYMTEIFRAGIQSIGKGQTEAAYALGMTARQTMQRVILPQAVRLIIPPVGNEFIAMLKDSSLVYIMGVWEVLFRAQKVGRQYFHSMETLFVAAVFYWMLTMVFSAFQERLERRMARGER